MPWFRIDDTLAFHAKTLAAGNAAMGLWVRAGAWSMQQLTDGHIPAHVARQLGTKAEATRLVTAGLWDEAENGYRMTEQGRLWQVLVGDWRPKISVEIRSAVMERDGRTCQTCGATSDLTLDHIHPYSRGGEDTPENLRVLCRPCNSRKGARV